MDPEELAERRRIKAEKRRATEERRRQKAADERALKERHRKLSKQEAAQANKRLDYLLKQSSIFAKLKLGVGSGNDPDPDLDDVAKITAKGKDKGSPNKHRAATASNNKKKKLDMNEDDSFSDDDESSSARHVFLTKQPNCIKFGTLKPYQVESLNWMIHLAEKGLNGILAGTYSIFK